MADADARRSALWFVADAHADLLLLCVVKCVRPNTYGGIVCILARVTTALVGVRVSEFNDPIIMYYYTLFSVS